MVTHTAQHNLGDSQLSQDTYVLDILSESWDLLTLQTWAILTCCRRYPARISFVISIRTHEILFSLSILCFHPQVNAKDDSGWTPLIIASSAGHSDCADLLITAGADLSCVTSNGQICLHYAASRNRVAIVETLIAAKVDVKARDNYGSSPLHRAASVGHLKVVKLLLKAGADPNAQDKEGNTSLHMAADGRNKEVFDNLKDAGGRPEIQNREGQTPSDLVTN